jgi:hypothetical protein
MNYLTEFQVLKFSPLIFNIMYHNKPSPLIPIFVKLKTNFQIFDLLKVLLYMLPQSLEKGMNLMLKIVRDAKN